jgi:hypothetical protein
MSRICLLCKENETPDGHCNICEPCYDNAGTLLEQNAELYVSAPKLLERCKMSLADAEAAIATPEEVAGYNWQSIAADLRIVIDEAEGSTEAAEFDRGLALYEKHKRR